jgi:hypothetical protein
MSSNAGPPGMLMVTIINILNHLLMLLLDFIVYSLAEAVNQVQVSVVPRPTGC